MREAAGPAGPGRGDAGGPAEPGHRGGPGRAGRRRGGAMMKVEGVLAVTPQGEYLRVREVWEENLEHEIKLIRNLVEEYPLVAMDTEFPGIVARPVGNFKNSHEYQYQTLRCNVDMLKLIQLGLTLCDDQGGLPKVNGELSVWQFNFKEFNLEKDMYAQDSIDLLKQSGINFEENEKRGIKVEHFGELLMTSGVVLNDDVQWITFHCGYDFGYLLKVLTCKPLPENEGDFFETLRIYFPQIYDMKYLMKFCDSLHGGLNKLAEVLEVERIGPQHQAGSDSLLTGLTFLKLVEKYFTKKRVEQHVGVLYGFEEASQAANSAGG